MCECVLCVRERGEKEEMSIIKSFHGLLSWRRTHLRSVARPLANPVWFEGSSPAASAMILNGPGLIRKF